MSEEDKTKRKAQVDEIAAYEALTEIEKLQQKKTLAEEALAAEISREEELKVELKALEDSYMQYLE